MYVSLYSSSSSCPRLVFFFGPRYRVNSQISGVIFKFRFLRRMYAYGIQRA